MEVVGILVRIVRPGTVEDMQFAMHLELELDANGAGMNLVLIIFLPAAFAGVRPSTVATASSSTCNSTNVDRAQRPSVCWDYLQIGKADIRPERTSEIVEQTLNRVLGGGDPASRELWNTHPPKWLSQP